MKNFFLFLGVVVGSLLAAAGVFICLWALVTYQVETPLGLKTPIWFALGITMLLIGALLKKVAELRRSLNGANAAWHSIIEERNAHAKRVGQYAAFIALFGSQDAVFSKLCELAEEYLTRCQGAPKLCSEWTFENDGHSSIDGFFREFGQTRTRVRQAAEDFTKAADSASFRQWGIFTIQEYLEHRSHLSEFLAKRGQEAEEARKAEEGKKNVIEQ